MTIVSFSYKFFIMKNISIQESVIKIKSLLFDFNHIHFPSYQVVFYLIPFFLLSGIPLGFPRASLMFTFGFPCKLKQKFIIQK